MASKAARKRAKKSRSISLPGGEVVAMRAGQGRRTDIEQSGPPPILAARKALCAVDPTSPLNESDMGRCILALSTGEERATLTEAWAAISASRRNFKTRIIGQTGDPKCATSPMMTEAMQTDQSLRVDLRTQDEKDRAASASWVEWQRKIDGLPMPQLKWALRGALDGFLGEAVLWRDQAPTGQGKLAVHALRMMG